ncbi:MAG: pyrroline-5-carboxylate reductase, partial [Actinobacteria bacterium]|nr:pyrroline-5-carboxylate reductase [Actinomycetota bacterium]
MSVKDYKLGIIGVGNMAEAILKGVLSSGLLRSTEMTAYEIKEARKKFIEKNY